MSKVENESRRRFLRRAGVVAVGGTVAVFAPDTLKKGAVEGLKGVIDGLNPFTPQEQEQVLGIVKDKVTPLNNVELARRPYVITSEIDKGWKGIPHWAIGEDVVLTSRWFADWKIEDFSGLTQPGKVVLVPDKRLVVMTLPRPKPRDIRIDIDYIPQIRRRKGNFNVEIGTGVIEEHDFNKMNKDAIAKMAKVDTEAADLADEVGKASLGAFCGNLLKVAGCMDATFLVAYEGNPTMADPAMLFDRGILSVVPDLAKPLQLYSPPDPEVSTSSTNPGQNDQRAQQGQPTSGH